MNFYESNEADYNKFFTIYCSCKHHYEPIQYTPYNKLAPDALKRWQEANKFLVSFFNTSIYRGDAWSSSDTRESFYKLLMPDRTIGGIYFDDLEAYNVYYYYLRKKYHMSKNGFC